MMPTDIRLPCMDNPAPFEAALISTAQGPHARAVRACRAICAGCGYRRECLETWGDQPGVIAGLTAYQRKRLMPIPRTCALDGCDLTPGPGRRLYCTPEHMETADDLRRNS